MARKLTGWNIFVAKVGKENPGKSFKEVLKLASTLKKQGKMNGTMSVSKGKKKKKSRRR
jgi:hypothetical protein